MLDCMALRTDCFKGLSNESTYGRRLNHALIITLASATAQWRLSTRTEPYHVTVTIGISYASLIALQEEIEPRTEALLTIASGSCVST